MRCLARCAENMVSNGRYDETGAYCPFQVKNRPKELNGTFSISFLLVDIAHTDDSKPEFCSLYTGANDETPRLLKTFIA